MQTQQAAAQAEVQKKQAKSQAAGNVRANKSTIGRFKNEQEAEL